MSEEDRYKITSNDYMDFIVEYNRYKNTFERYPNSTVQIINERYAVLYVPSTTLSEFNISNYGYNVLPTLYGLCSEKSMDASNINKLRNLPGYNLRGQGVIVGIIDTGIDYTNPVFQYNDGTTKIITLWDQTIESNQYPEPFNYGSQYYAVDINKALKSTNPYEEVPSRDDIGHGTMLAGIAAGSVSQENDFYGAAPDAELIVVKLKQAKQLLRNFYLIPQDAPCYQENDIIWALQYIVDTARRYERPVAICIGLGSSQGSHSGLGTLSNMVNNFSNYTGVAVSLAAGNEGNTRRHYYAEINPSIGRRTVELNVGDGETGFTIQVWGSVPNSYSIDILSPSGEYIPRISENVHLKREVGFVFEKTEITIYYQMAADIMGNQLILIRLNNPTPGIWRFQVYGSGDIRGSFHSWLPINDFITKNTYFVQSDPFTTITSPGNAQVPITVTAYNQVNNDLYQGVSRGYTQTDIVKPEIAAPGVNIQAPTLNHEFTVITGTGAAVAHVAGVMALMLEWGIIKGNYPSMNTVIIKKYIIRGAKRKQEIIYPNRDWGYGILDVFNIFDMLQADIKNTPF